MKKCPYCAEEIQDEAIKCKHCGEMLTAAPQPSSVSPPRRKAGRPLLKAIGLLLLVVGVGTVAYFLMFYDTSVGVGQGRVHNTGLMQNRQNGVIVGLAVAAAGLACFLVGQLSTASSAPKAASAIKLPSGGTVLWVCIVLGLVLFLGILIYSNMSYIEGLKHNDEEGRKRMYGS